MPLSNQQQQDHDRNFGRMIIYRGLKTSFYFLSLTANIYGSRRENVNRTSLEKLQVCIFTWVDRSLQNDDWPVPPVQAKERLFQAFTDLAVNHARFPFTDQEPTHCPVCGNKLVTAYNQPLVCERCVKPVLDALDDLIRATSTEWTPEELRESYLNALKSVQISE